MSFTLSVLPWENPVINRAIYSNNAVFAGFNHLKFCCSGDWVFKIFCFANQDFSCIPANV